MHDTDLKPACDAWLRGFDPELSRELGRRDLLGMTWPARFGGAGRSNLARLVVTEELLRAGAPVGAHWMGDRQIGPAILRYGSPELQNRYLPAITRGELTSCLGMSETESGSDLASVRTRAIKDPTGWRITGRKVWTSHAHRATHAYVLARTGRGERKHDGLTEFIVDMSAPGIEVRPIYDLSGSHHFNEVIFDEVSVPDDHVLGEVGAGWSQVTEQLSFERGGIERVLSTYPLLASVIDTVGDRSDVSERAGQLLSRLAVLQEMVRTVAKTMDTGQAPIQLAAMLKVAGNAFEQDVNEFARWALDAETDPGSPGSSGLLTQGVLASPGFSIRGGTTEVLRDIIGRSVDVEGPPSHLRDVIDDVLNGVGGEPAERVSTIWSTIERLGWSSIGVDEDSGGSGGDLEDLLVLSEGLGRHTVSVPVIETALARSLLASPSRAPDPGIATVVLPSNHLSLADAVLHGDAQRVPWASAARLLVVYVGDDVVAAIPTDTPGVHVSAGHNLAGEPRDNIMFEHVSVTPDMIVADVQRSSVTAAKAALLSAAAMTGAMENAVDAARQHVSERAQFGKPLIRFQAVRHKLADLATELALARTAVAMATHDLERVAVAKTQTAHAATTIAQGTHQLLGAMGVTQEHPLHLATRRLWSWRDEWGTQRNWASSIGAQLLPRGSDAVWSWLTSDRPFDGETLA